MERVTAEEFGRSRYTRSGRPKSGGYDALVQAKRLADAMGGIDKARAALDVLARLV